MSAVATRTDPPADLARNRDLRERRVHEDAAVLSQSDVGTWRWTHTFDPSGRCTEKSGIKRTQSEAYEALHASTTTVSWPSAALNSQGGSYDHHRSASRKRRPQMCTMKLTQHEVTDLEVALEELLSKAEEWALRTASSSRLFDTEVEARVEGLE